MKVKRVKVTRCRCKRFHQTSDFLPSYRLQIIPSLYNKLGPSFQLIMAGGEFLKTQEAQFGNRLFIGADLGR